MTLELRCEQPFAETDPVVLAHLVGGAAPYFLGRLDNESRGFAVELVDVGLEPTVLGLLERNVNASKRFFVPSRRTGTANVDLRTEEVAESACARRC